MMIPRVQGRSGLSSERTSEGHRQALLVGKLNPTTTEQWPEPVSLALASREKHSFAGQGASAFTLALEAELGPRSSGSCASYNESGKGQGEPSKQASFRGNQPPRAAQNRNSAWTRTAQKSCPELLGPCRKSHLAWKRSLPCPVPTQPPSSHLAQTGDHKPGGRCEDPSSQKLTAACLSVTSTVPE